jgi:cell division protein FtsL
MSTTFDLRGLAAPPSTEADAVARPKPAAPRRATSRRPAAVAGNAARPVIAGRSRVSFAAIKQGVLRSGRAGLCACAILILSTLGLIYITQISHVARYGYRLSALQQQQATLDRENQLLQNRLDTERTLAQASKLAATDYKMQPLLDGARTTISASAAPRVGVTATATVASRNAPQIRFVTAQRPRVAAGVPAAPATPLTVIDRLWNRLVGVGVARAAE